MIHIYVPKEPKGTSEKHIQKRMTPRSVTSSERAADSDCQGEQFPSESNACDDSNESGKEDNLFY